MAPLAEVVKSSCVSATVVSAAFCALVLTRLTLADTALIDTASVAIKNMPPAPALALSVAAPTSRRLLDTAMAVPAWSITPAACTSATEPVLPSMMLRTATAATLP